MKTWLWIAQLVLMLVVALVAFLAGSLYGPADCPTCPEPVECPVCEEPVARVDTFTVTDTLALEFDCMDPPEGYECMVGWVGK